MKRLLSLGIFILLFTILYASGWTSDVKIAYEFENTSVNTGNGTEATATNNGSIAYSSIIKYAGTYSAGPITGAQNFQVTMASTANTVQVAVYALSAGKPTETEYWNKAASHSRLYDYSGGAYFVGDTTQIGPFSYSFNVWNVWVVTWSGGVASVYLNGALKGTITSQQPVAGDVIEIGNLGTSYGCNCYVDNFITSTNNSAGVEITPQPPTPTFTLTSTLTFTLTPTLTWTLTPTLTYTPTPTLTHTLTVTLTSSVTQTPIMTPTPTLTSTPVPIISVPTQEHSLTLRVQAITNDHMVLAIHSERWTSTYILMVNGIPQTLQFPYDPKTHWWYWMIPVNSYSELYLQATYNGIIVRSHALTP
jgi:hypothetical protein